MNQPRVPLPIGLVPGEEEPQEDGPAPPPGENQQQMGQPRAPLPAESAPGGGPPKGSMATNRGAMTSDELAFNLGMGALRDDAAADLGKTILALMQFPKGQQDLRALLAFVEELRSVQEAYPIKDTNNFTKPPPQGGRLELQPKLAQICELSRRIGYLKRRTGAVRAITNEIQNSEITGSEIDAWLECTTNALLKVDEVAGRLISAFLRLERRLLGAVPPQDPARAVLEAELKSGLGICRENLYGRPHA